MTKRLSVSTNAVVDIGACVLMKSTAFYCQAQLESVQYPPPWLKNDEISSLFVEPEIPSMFSGSLVPQVRPWAAIICFTFTSQAIAS
jgi:hypothetical protein